MKKAITLIITAIIYICIFSLSVSAEKAIKAPTVQYKLINHDEVKLRWSKSEGADSYYIYVKNSKTGGFVKEGTVKTTSCTITELEASTEYTYGVVAVKQIKNGILKSKIKTVTFTTPEEWYYSDNYYSDETNIIYRKHYNGTGEEAFDVTPIMDKLDAYSKSQEVEEYDETVVWGSVNYNPICYKSGYVFFKVNGYTIEDSGFVHIIKMKNDGTDIKIEASYNDYECTNTIFIDEYKGMNILYVICNEDEFKYIYRGYEIYEVEEQINKYKSNQETEWWANFDDMTSYLTAEMWEQEKEGADDLGIKSGGLFIDHKCVLSGPVTDGKSLYVLSEPLYNITDKTDAIIYKLEYDGSKKEKFFTIPKDSDYIYGSIKLFDCDGEYLYYKVFGKHKDETDYQNDFYRISLNKKDSKPEKITSLSLFKLKNTEICNGYLYLECYVSEEDYYDKKMTYYRVKTNGKNITKQNKPFEWRY